jgi:Domain of unknown function (DUF4345)
VVPDHRRLTQAFLVANSLFWLPWGLVCLVWPEAWSGDVIDGMNVFDLSEPIARTEVRAMYGGLQMAIGLLALLGAFRDRHRDTTLVFFVLALTGLAACRFAGMVIEGDQSYLTFAVDGIPPGKYNQVGLAMYELPNVVLAWALLLTRPSGRPRGADDQPSTTGDAAELERLRTENATLRAALSERSVEQT